MKRIRRYLIRLSIAFLAFVLGFAVYLFAPPLRSTIKDVPHEPPIALVPSKENKGKRCDSGVKYDYEKDQTVIVNQYCVDLQSKLLKAVGSEGSLEEIKQLLSQGANPNEIGMINSQEGYNIFPATIYSKDVNVVKLLLDNGADINQIHICCASHSTALVRAVSYQQTDIVRLLLARGADVNIEEFGGVTPFEIAAENGYEDIAQLFDEAGKISLIQRAELRIAKLPFVNIKDIHKTFKALDDSFKPLGDRLK